MINLKYIIQYNIINKFLYSEFSTESKDDINEMKKKLRILHKLDSVQSIQNVNRENVNKQSITKNEQLTNQFNDTSFEMPDKEQLDKVPNQNPRHLKFLNSLLTKNKNNNDFENVILANYGVIRTDNINQINDTKNSKRYTLSVENKDKNIENEYKNEDVQYFSSIINKAPELLDKGIENSKVSILSKNYSKLNDDSDLKLSQSSISNNNLNDNLLLKLNSNDFVMKDNFFDEQYFQESFPPNEDFIDNINISLNNNRLGNNFVGNDIFSINNDSIDVTNDVSTNIMPLKVINKDVKLKLEKSYMEDQPLEESFNIFDADYFPNIDKSQKDQINFDKSAEPETFFDKCYFNNRESAYVENNHENVDTAQIVPGKKLRKKFEGNIVSKNVCKSDNKLEYAINNSTETNKSPEEGNDIINHRAYTRREQKNKEKYFVNLEEPKTAFDLVMKMRKEKVTTGLGTNNDISNERHSEPRNIGVWKGRLDSKGFKLLKDQTIDLKSLPRDDVVSILKDSVLYEDDKIVMIDKPFGLPSHGGKGVVHSVGQLLADLTLRLDKKAERPLHLVHRLDKDTTGILILARSPQSANILQSMFNGKQIIKKYWTITKGVPIPTEGVIDIPMGEGTVVNKYRMELRPLYPREMRLLHNIDKYSSVKSYPAVTYYRVISHHLDAALVECQPETGVRHQIRCHLSFGLNTPILGDHKFSHYNKLAPQKLPGSMLQRLGVRQETVRHIPIHLHCHSVVLQHYDRGRNLFVSAKPPAFFMQNLKWLKLAVK